MEVALKDRGNDADEAHDDWEARPFHALTDLTARNTGVNSRWRTRHVELDRGRKESNDERTNALLEKAHKFHVAFEDVRVSL